MNPFFAPREKSYLPKIRLLRSRTLDGKPYRRPERVEAEIAEIMSLRQHERAERLPYLQNETLVYVIRRMRLSSKSVYGRFVRELTQRIARIAYRHTCGLKKVTRLDISSNVEIRIMTLVLADKPSRKTEILEVAFARAVEKLTLNTVRSYEHSPWAHMADIPTPADEDNDEEVERPIEQAVDNRDGPEIQVIQSTEDARRAQQVATAYAAVKDQLDLKALKLHIVDGLPIGSKDPDKPDVISELGESRGRVNYRISRAFKQIRKVFGGRK